MPSLRNPLGCLSLFVLVACQHTTPTESADTDAAKTLHPDAALPCPSKDFSTFFTAFAENKAIQRHYVSLPLKQMTQNREAEPEPVPVMRMLSGSEISFPVIPDASQRKARSLSLRVDTVAGNEAIASLYGENTDYLVYYIFNNTNACWRLVGIEDWSL